jgi:hypothetical protein
MSFVYKLTDLLAQLVIPLMEFSPEQEKQLHRSETFLEVYSELFLMLLQVLQVLL